MIMMKNWVVKLLSVLIVPSLLGIVFTYLLRSDLESWIDILSYVLAPLISTLITAFFFRVRWSALLSILIAVTSIAFNVPLQNWLFHSADEVVRYASINELYEEKDKPIYFTFDHLEVDYSKKSSVTILRSHMRRVSKHSYRTEKKSYTYTVAPAFEDTLPRKKYAEREVKAWVIPVKHSKDMPLVGYEWYLFDKNDYKQAIAKSRCMIQHPDAPIIRPLYKQFITKKEWKRIFINTGCIVLSLLIMLGVIMNYREAKK